ncbi:hypothetical protein [Bradyrhizobium sp. BR 1432]|uniref:hypothetical protein n=1 Tax=Bradyrhizobium sp. BR 1432 TaxID=3447966 RepID=UPI003EE5FFF8
MNSSITFAGVAIGAFIGGLLIEISGVTSLAVGAILIGIIGVGLAIIFMRDRSPAEVATAA